MTDLIRPLDDGPRCNSCGRAVHPSNHLDGPVEVSWCARPECIHMMKHGRLDAHLRCTGCGKTFDLDEPPDGVDSQHNCKGGGDIVRDILLGGGVGHLELVAAHQPSETHRD